MPETDTTDVAGTVWVRVEVDPEEEAAEEAGPAGEDPAGEETAGTEAAGPVDTAPEGVPGTTVVV